MKRWKEWLSILVSVTFFVGCGGVSISNLTSSKQNVNEVTKYKGPKARIAVASFKCKAAKCNGAIGSGIADMLTTELVKSGKFIVVERGEGLSAVEREYGLNTSMNRPVRNLEGADILVVGAITAFEPKAGGLTAGGIVVPKGVPFIGGMKFGKNEAYIAVDLRLIDVRTGRVIAATTVEGKTSDWKIGGLGGGVAGVGIVGGGLSTYKNTPMEKAIRVMIAKAVKEIERLVPENYYRYDGSGNPVNTSSSAAVASTSQSSAQKGIYTLIFQEDFEKYGIGQTPPFGSWVGDKKVSVTMGVQKNGQIGKILKAWEYNRICNRDLKVQNAVYTVDFIRNIVFSFMVVNQKPFIGYIVSAFAYNGEVNLEKKAGNTKIKIAQNNVHPSNAKWHTLKVVANGSHITVYMDDQLAIDLNDNDKTLQQPGSVCLECACCESYIDNLKIYKIK